MCDAIVSKARQKRIVVEQRDLTTIYATQKTALIWHPGLTGDRISLIGLLIELETIVDLCAYILGSDVRKTNTYKAYVGKDKIKRSFVIDAFDHLSYEVATYNGSGWISVNKHICTSPINSALLYEVTRATFTLDWPELWITGFSCAMAVLISEILGYTNMLEIRQARLADLDKYIDSDYTDVWSLDQLPWNPYQSASDVIAGLIIRISDAYGIEYLSRIFCLEKININDLLEIIL